MKKLLALALFAISLCAQAQSVPINEKGFNCSPLAGKALRWALNATTPGGWMSWWCLGTDGRYHLQLQALPIAQVLAVSDDYAKVLEAPNYATAMNAFLKANPAVAIEPTDPTIKPIWIGSVAKIEGSKPADPAPPVTPPAPKAWTVAPNGTAKTRQWYAYVDGVRAKSGGGSVTIAGTVCKPEVATVAELGAVYAAFGPTFRADRVTVCEAK